MPFPPPKHGPDIQIGLHLAWDLKEIKVERGVLQRKILWQDTRYPEPTWKEESCITFLNDRIARRSTHRTSRHETKPFESKQIQATATATATATAINNEDENENDDNNNDDDNENNKKDPTSIQHRNLGPSRTSTSDTSLKNSPWYSKQKPTHHPKSKTTLKASFLLRKKKQKDKKRHSTLVPGTTNTVPSRPQRARQPTNRFVPPNKSWWKKDRPQSPRKMAQEAMQYKPDPSSEVSSSDESFHSYNSSWSDIDNAPAKERITHKHYASFHQLHKTTSLDAKISDSGSKSDNNSEEWCVPTKPNASLATASEKKQHQQQAQHINQLSNTRCYDSKDIQNIRALNFL